MSVWERVVREIDRLPEEIRDLRVVPEGDPRALRRELARRYTFEEAIPLDRLTGEVIRLLRDGTVHVTHPRYFGLFNPSVREAGIVADTLSALFNPQLAAWSHAPAVNELERLVLGRFAREIGFDPETAAANFTSGGAEANLSAVLAAIAHRHPEAAERGVASLPGRPCLYLSGESHHSFVKIARMTGLGTDAVREVAVDDGFALDAVDLRRRIEEDRRAGMVPLVIVGTAGTTSAGVIDPLPALADLAREHGAWFHVDAAWAASALLVPGLRESLAGIERADSVTWDAHKWLSVPMGAGMFFCRHPGAVRRAFAINTSYMPPAAGEEMTDPYAATAQWSRRATGLKVFMALAELGAGGYADLIRRQTEVGARLRRRLEMAGWIPLNRTPLPLVCFTHADIRSGRIDIAGILRTIYARGRVWISEVTLGGRERALRACITSFRTDESDLDCLIGELEHARGG
jgi:aromatic-L-amino-acid decarboxylase